MMENLVWKAYYHSMSGHEIRPFNIFEHGRFREEVRKLLLKCTEKEAFAEELRRSLFYYYCSKCEWEVVIGPWFGDRGTKEIKVDVYMQVMNNWDIFVDYDTALQLTGFDPVMASIRHYDFADAAKDTPFYKEIIPAMLDYFETEHYVFTHGWIPSIPNRDKSYSYISSWREADREQWNQARWFNGMDAAQTADENKTIVCGHWHTSYGHSKYEHKGTEFGEDADFSPYYGPGIIAIDACTAFSGKVNCLVIED